MKVSEDGLKDAATPSCKRRKKKRRKRKRILKISGQRKSLMPGMSFKPSKNIIT